MTPTPPQLINSLDVSTSSAHMIVMQFVSTNADNILDLSVLIPITISAFSFFAALMSAISAHIANNIAKSMRSYDVLKLFFDVTRELPMDGKTRLTVDQKQFVCNYFEFISFSILKKRLRKDEIELIENAMKTPLFIYFMTNYRSKHGESSYKYYYKWFSKQSKK